MDDPSCGHCGFRGPVEHKDTVLLKREEEEVTGEGTVEGSHSVGVWVCPVCEEPTVWFWVYFSDLNRNVRERPLYPTVRDNNALPERVRKRLDAARRVKSIDPDLFAVGIRRMLEAVCNEERAEGKTYSPSSTTSPTRAASRSCSPKWRTSCGSLAISAPTMRTWP